MPFSSGAFFPWAEARIGWAHPDTAPKWARKKADVAECARPGRSNAGWLASLWIIPTAFPLFMSNPAFEEIIEMVASTPHTMLIYNHNGGNHSGGCVALATG